MKRLTVVYEVPDTYDVTRITGTGELEVVKCEWSDALSHLADALAALERLKEEVDLHKARAICELADEGDEAAHECGWVVCGCCWNNAAAAHKKVAEQLNAQLTEAQARNASLSGQLVAADHAMETLRGQLTEARAECERLRKRVAYNPWSHHITCAVWNGSAACTCKHPFTNEAAAAGGE